MNIEKNIPIPEARGRKPNGTYSESINALQVGDSFVAEGVNAATVQSAIRQAAKRAGIKITTRRIDKPEDAGTVKIRVWRIEGEAEAVAQGAAEE